MSSLSGGETFDFGGVKVQALACPGHTPGSTCYLVEKGGSRVLFTGDVIMQLGGEQTAGIYSAYLAPRYRGDTVSYLNTLRTLRAMPVPDLVLPGHPFSDSSPQSPRLSPSRWTSMLDAAIGDLEILRDRHRADGPDFLDGQPKAILPGVWYLGDVEGRAVYALAGSKGLALVHAPGDSGLAERVADRLKKLGVEPSQPSVVLLTTADPSAIGGLRGVVERWHPTVVAPEDSLQAVRDACPAGTAIVPASPTLPDGLGEAIPLGQSSAFVLSREGKTVLLTGRFPILFDHDSTEALARETSGSRDSVMDYLAALDRLARLRPDVWLPAVPSEGQNANLYDREWETLIANNFRLGYHELSRAVGPALPRPSPPGR